MPETICSQCKRPVVYAARERPTTCGRVLCRSRADWGDEEWAGAARMAEVRRANGVELNEVDREALHRINKET